MSFGLYVFQRYIKQQCFLSFQLLEWINEICVIVHLYSYLPFISYSVVDDEYICLYDTPEGLHLLKDFLTKEEEQQFYSYFDWMDGPIKDKKLKNRLVKHFGYEFRYGTNDVDLKNPLERKIPDICNVLWERLIERGFDFGIPDQLTVNKYIPGQGISLLL